MGLEDNQGNKLCLPHPSSTWWQWVVLPRVSVEFMHCWIAALCKKMWFNNDSTQNMWISTCWNTFLLALPPSKKMKTIQSQSKIHHQWQLCFTNHTTSILICSRKVVLNQKCANFLRILPHHWRWEPLDLTGLLNVGGWETHQLWDPSLEKTWCPKRSENWRKLLQIT